MHAAINFHPGAEAALSKRLWQGCPTVLCTEKGTLYAGWYTGGTQEPSYENYNVLVRSTDGGKTWSEPLLTIASSRKEKCLDIDIQLWLDPKGRMWIFWVERNMKIWAANPEHLHLYAMVCDDPDSAVFQCGEPQFIDCGFLRCQPTVLSDGRYLLCDYDYVTPEHHYTESYDEGKTWVSRRGGKKLETDFDETMVFETKDHVLRMFARTVKTGVLAESDSFDGGKTWTDAAKTGFTSPATRAFIRRLKSGNVLMIRNDHPAIRTNMTAFLSEDDGKTFPYSILLDARFNVSYPDAAEMPDGSIMMIHDADREVLREIVTSRLTEDDIRAGKIVSEGSWVNRILCRAPEKRWCSDEEYKLLHDREVKDLEDYNSLGKKN